LQTYKPNPQSNELAYDVHFWIGSQSTQVVQHCHLNDNNNNNSDDADKDDYDYDDDNEVVVLELSRSAQLRAKIITVCTGRIRNGSVQDRRTGHSFEGQTGSAS